MPKRASVWIEREKALFYGPQSVTRHRHLNLIYVAVTRAEYLSASEDKRASARLMRAKGMTQAAIAKELGVHVNSVANWLKQ